MASEVVKNPKPIPREYLPDFQCQSQEDYAVAEALLELSPVPFSPASPSVKDKAKPEKFPAIPSLSKSLSSPADRSRSRKRSICIEGPLTPISHLLSLSPLKENSPFVGKVKINFDDEMTKTPEFDPFDNFPERPVKVSSEGWPLKSAVKDSKLTSSSKIDNVKKTLNYHAIIENIENLAPIFEKATYTRVKHDDDHFNSREYKLHSLPSSPPKNEVHVCSPSPANSPDSKSGSSTPRAMSIQKAMALDNGTQRKYKPSLSEIPASKSQHTTSSTHKTRSQGSNSFQSPHRSPCNVPNREPNPSNLNKFESSKLSLKHELDGKYRRDFRLNHRKIPFSTSASMLPKLSSPIVVSQSPYASPTKVENSESPCGNKFSAEKHLTVDEERPTIVRADDIKIPPKAASIQAPILSAQRQPILPKQPQLDIPDRNPKPCNCKRSKCLKLYCDCFGASILCKGCNCVDCFNDGTKEHERLRAIKSLLQRKPNAFKDKFAKQGSSAQAQHSQGCNCKRSACLKKYCECFHGDAYCGDNCKCTNCENFEGSYSLEKAKAKRDMENGIIPYPVRKRPRVLNEDSFFVSESQAYYQGFHAEEARSRIASSKELHLVFGSQQVYTHHPVPQQSSYAPSMLPKTTRAHTWHGGDQAMDHHPHALWQTPRPQQPSTRQKPTSPLIRKPYYASEHKYDVDVNDQVKDVFGPDKPIPKGIMMQVLDCLENDDIYNACLVKRSWVPLCFDEALWDK
mmetsp:Transcript_26194/g.33959  ORF Transcript_26194/g.33959 Transcript_26194/m.33959 type:complete len:740 (-) Transcript_26194:372-2591(-)